MPDPFPWPLTDRVIDAVVLLRLDARGVARESLLLSVDRPAVSLAQLHASLARMSPELRAVGWDRERHIARGAGALAYHLRSSPDIEWREALTVAWHHGNAWRGAGMPLFGLPAVAMPVGELREWTYRWARQHRLSWWPPDSDHLGPAPC